MDWVFHCFILQIHKMKFDKKIAASDDLLAFIEIIQGDGIKIQKF